MTKPATCSSWRRIHLLLEGICGVPENNISRGNTLVTLSTARTAIAAAAAAGCWRPVTEDQWSWTSDWIEQLAANLCPLALLLSAWRPFQKIQNCTYQQVHWLLDQPSAWNGAENPLQLLERKRRQQNGNENCRQWKDKVRLFSPQHGFGWPAASLSFGPEEAAVEWCGIWSQLSNRHFLVDTNVHQGTRGDGVKAA